MTREAYDGDRYQAQNMDFFVSLRQTTDCVEPDYTDWRSRECVKLRDDPCSYLYLESGSGMLSDIYYVVEEDGGERVQTAKIFDDQTQTALLKETTAG